jgi:phosphatidylinositol alpha-1,6-mannosyltransferase
MRALALVTDAWGASGGIGQFNRDFLGALAGMLHTEEVRVLVRSGSGITPANIVQAPAHRSRGAFAAHGLATAARGGWDVVFCGHLFLLPAAVIAARLARAPLWLQLHGIEAWRAPPLARRLVKRAQLVTSVSRFTRERFLAWAALEPERVKVLPNTVEDRFTVTKPHEPHADRILLTVSRLSRAERYKGHDRVIEALALLSLRHPRLRYVIAGEGDDRPRLEALARLCGVAANVHFVGHVPDEALPSLYRSADVFVMPSTGEGFGIVFLQALASGVPVVAGAADGSRDPLRDGNEGTLLDDMQPAAVAAAIERALANPRSGSGWHAFAPENFRAHVSSLAAELVAGAPE